MTAVAVMRQRELHRVALTGDLDLEASAEVEASVDALFATGPRAVILDLSGLTFMDSTGLRLLLLVKERAASIGCALAVIPGPPNIQRVFDLTGLAQALPWIHAAVAGAN